MSAERGCVRRARRGAWLPIALLLGVLAPAFAQESASEAPASSSLQLRGSSKLLLSRLQSGWLEWVSAVNAGEVERAGTAIDEALAYADQVGMRALPELSVAAALHAVETSAEGHDERAELALAAAERLDPGRPETEFARARIAWENGSYPRAWLHHLLGYVRALRLPFERELLLHVMAEWLLHVVVLTLLLMLALQMAAKGSLLYRDLRAFSGRYLPLALSHALAVAAVAWPLLLPGNVYWLAIYWPLLLWPYCGRFARALTLLAWVTLASAPLLQQEQARLLRGVFTPALHSVQGLSEGRLYGGLLNDLADLEARLPGSAAIDHVTADVHRLLGQCDTARARYQQVIDREANPAAFNDLGTCYFESGSYALAIDAFQSAAAGARSAIVQFNLSRSHSELYNFSEQEAALRLAREIDSELVTEFMRRESLAGVVPWNGGFERVEEIRSELAGSATEADARTTLTRAWSRGLFLPMVIVFVAIAFAVRFLTRGSRGRGLTVSGDWFRGRGELVRRLLLPGTPEAEEGDWGRALVAVLVPVALLSLPLVDSFGLRVPWGIEPLRSTFWVLALLGLVPYALYRLAAQLSRI